MCISKIHPLWHTLTFGFPLHPFPLRNSAAEASHVVKQLVNKSQKTTPKRQHLRRDINAKPSGQSTSASESTLGTPSSIIEAKESSRFRLDRPVDAHFRFEPSEAPTPNRSEPPRQTRRTAAQGPSRHRVEIPSRLSKPLARQTSPNIADFRSFFTNFNGV